MSLNSCSCFLLFYLLGKELTIFDRVGSGRCGGELGGHYCGGGNSIHKENQSQTLLLQHAAYHQIKGFFDFPCPKVDSENLILNTY